MTLTNLLDLFLNSAVLVAIVALALQAWDWAWAACAYRRALRDRER